MFRSPITCYHIPTGCILAIAALREAKELMPGGDLYGIAQGCVMILEKGTLVNAQDNSVNTYEIRRLGPADLEGMLRLQEEVCTAIADHELFVPGAPEVLSLDLMDQGFTIGFIVNGELAGYTSLHYIIHDGGNPECEIECGRDLIVPECGLGQVARFRFTAIHPDYRGNKMCTRMSHRILRLAKEEGRPTRYLCSMLSPKNYPSLADQFSNNMVAIGLKLNRKGYERFIMFQDLVDPVRLGDGPLFRAVGSDIEKIRNLLDQGNYAFRLDSTTLVATIVFGRAAAR